jgi:hypothetical protein
MMLARTDGDGGLSAVDREAMTRAITMAKERSRRERERLRDGKSQIQHMLETRPWIEVGKFCAYSCQRRSLGLKPWEWAPVSVRVDDPNPEHSEAHKLLKRLLANNLSRFEPDPVAALAAIEAR